MANVIIKSDERRKNEREVLKDYGIDPNRATAAQKEYAEAINHGTDQAYSEMRRYN